MLELSAETSAVDTNTQFIAGTTNFDAWVRNNNLKDMSDTSLVNPFVNVILENLEFAEILVNKYYVSFGDFNENNISLTPSTYGVHLPNSVQTYMNTTFYEQLCSI